MYNKYTIYQFMQAWFEKNYSELNQEDFKIVYAEYLDSSGLFLTEDFEKVSLIQHLNQRINFVKIFIRLQREFIKENFGKPFLRTKELETLKQEYGYVLKWNEDFDDFEQQLKKIESREIKHNTFLEEKIKELNDSRKANNKKEFVEENEDSLKKSRINFIRMLNSLGKIGYKLDKKVTTVEELALMIKQQTEEAEDIKMR